MRAGCGGGALFQQGELLALRLGDGLRALLEAADILMYTLFQFVFFWRVGRQATSAIKCPRTPLSRFRMKITSRYCPVLIPTCPWPRPGHHCRLVSCGRLYCFNISNSRDSTVSTRRVPGLPDGSPGMPTLSEGNVYLMLQRDFS